jgi:hypothetical protein
MKKVAKNLNHLELVGCCKSKLRKAILKNSDKDLIITICECVYNLLCGNVITDRKILKKLESHKKTMRKLVSSNDSIESKRNLLIQKGGFLPIIIPTILDLVTRLFKQE